MVSKLLDEKIAQYGPPPMHKFLVCDGDFVLLDRVSADFLLRNSVVRTQPEKPQLPRHIQNLFLVFWLSKAIKPERGYFAA